MLILGWYILAFEQLYQLGLRRGLVIEDGNVHVLNDFFNNSGIDFIHAFPVDYPRVTPTTEGCQVSWLLHAEAINSLDILQTAYSLR